MQSTSIIRRWIRGSLLITVLVLVLAEGLFLYYSYNDLYGGVERAVDGKQIIYIEKLDNEVKIQAEKYKWIYKERNFSKSEIEILFKELLKAQEEKKRIYILAETKEKAKKICSLLNEKEIINKYEENLNQTIIVKNTESLVTVSVGKLSSGFECFDTNQLVITSQE